MNQSKAEHNEENLEFLIEVQIYKSRLLPCTRAYHGKKIVDKYIKTGSEKEVNIPAYVLISVDDRLVLNL